MLKSLTLKIWYRTPSSYQKSDGATLYITRDLAAALYRKRTYDFAKAIYVVGNEQSAHFKQLKAVLNEMGFEWNEDITHVPFGLVTKEGKNCQLVKVMLSFLNQQLPKLSNALKTKSMLKILTLLTRKQSLTLLASALSNSTI